MNLLFSQAMLNLNAGGPFGEVINALNQVAGAIKPLALPIGIIMLVGAGIMFMTSQRLSEQAKPMMMRVCVGMLIVGGAATFAGWMSGISGF